MNSATIDVCTMQVKNLKFSYFLFSYLAVRIARVNNRIIKNNWNNYTRSLRNMGSRLVHSILSKIFQGTSARYFWKFKEIFARISRHFSYFGLFILWRVFTKTRNIPKWPQINYLIFFQGNLKVFAFMNVLCMMVDVVNDIAYTHKKISAKSATP